MAAHLGVIGGRKYYSLSLILSARNKLKLAIKFNKGYLLVNVTDELKTHISFRKALYGEHIIKERLKVKLPYYNEAVLDDLVFLKIGSFGKYAYNGIDKCLFPVINYTKSHKQEAVLLLVFMEELKNYKKNGNITRNKE